MAVQHPRRLVVGLGAAALSFAGMGGWQALAASTPSFTPRALEGPSLNQARRRPVATTLPTGQVLIAGGNGSGGTASYATLASAELFDPSTDTLTRLTGAEQSLTEAREGAIAAALPSGQVLIAGGLKGGPGALSSAELFNPSTDTFTKLAQSLTEARAFAVSATLANGKILIAGGEPYSSHASGTKVSAEIFDPATDTFARLTGTEQSLTEPRACAVAATLPSGQVLIAGGHEPFLGAKSSAELFNPSTDTFTKLTGSGQSLTEPREGAVAATLPNGEVLIAGGAYSPETRDPSRSSAELFDPATDTFTKLSGTEESLTEPRENAVAATLASGEVVIADGEAVEVPFGSHEYFGYSGTPHALSTAELFNPATDTFSRIPGIGQSIAELEAEEATAHRGATTGATTATTNGGTTGGTITGTATAGTTTNTGTATGATTGAGAGTTTGTSTTTGTGGATTTGTGTTTGNASIPKSSAQRESHSHKKRVARALRACKKLKKGKRVKCEKAAKKRVGLGRASQ